MGGELEQKVETEVLKSESVEEVKPVEYETDFVRKAMENKDKNLFKRAKNFRSSISTFQSTYTTQGQNYVKKIEDNDRKLKELFEEKKTFWTELKKTWYRLTGREYNERERTIDKMIREASTSVKSFDRVISESKQIKEELDQHYLERKELKAELSDRIDDCNALITELNDEISKYKRDYTKLDKEKEYKLRDVLEVEIDKLSKDNNNLNLELQLADTEYIFVNNITQTLDPLSEQIQRAIDNSVILKRQGELYVEEAEALKGVIVGFSKLVQYGVDLQKYMDKIGTSFNQGIGILSQNLDLIIEAVGKREPKLFETGTIKDIRANNSSSKYFTQDKEQSRSEEITDIRSQPGKYSKETED